MSRKPKLKTKPDPVVYSVRAPVHVKRTVNGHHYSLATRLWTWGPHEREVVEEGVRVSRWGPRHDRRKPIAVNMLTLSDRTKASVVKHTVRLSRAEAIHMANALLEAVADDRDESDE